MKFFTEVKTNYGQETATKWYYKLTYEKFLKGETIFDYGDIGTKFFIVLKGKVAWKVPFLKEITTKDKNFKNWRDFLWEDETRCKVYDDLRNKNAYRLVSTTPEGMLVLQAKILEQVTVMDDGKAFGDLALISKKPRAASMDWIEDTDLAVLNK